MLLSLLDIISVFSKDNISCFLTCQGFYSVSGSSLSDSCYSVSSDAAQGVSAPPARPLKLWDQVPMAADNTAILWSEGAVQQQPTLQNRLEDSEPTEETPVSGELVQTIQLQQSAEAG